MRIFEQLNNRLVIPGVRIEQLHHALFGFLTNVDRCRVEEQGAFPFQKILKLRRVAVAYQRRKRGIAHFLNLTGMQHINIFALQTKPQVVPVCF